MHRLIVLFVFGTVTLAGCKDHKGPDNSDIDDTVDLGGDELGVDTALPGDDGAGDDGSGDDSAGGGGDVGAGDDGSIEGGDDGDAGTGDDGSSSGGDVGAGDDGSDAGAGGDGGDAGTGDDGSSSGDGGGDGGDVGTGDGGDVGTGDDGSGDGGGDDGSDDGSGDGEDTGGDVGHGSIEICDGVDNDGDDVVDEGCEDVCWDRTPCLTWYQANALGYLEVATSSTNTSVQVTNLGLDQDICFDRAIYTSDTTQAFFVDQALVDDDVRIAPGETVDVYYASYTTANGSHETYLDEYAWWCVELGQSTSKSKTYDYFGEFPPSGLLEFSDVDNDVDADGTEDHVDWAGGYGIQSQYSIWDYQADSTVLTAGKLATLGLDGKVDVTTLSRNLGAYDGTGTLTDTVPMGWSVSDMSVTPDTTTTNSDGTTTYTWAVSVDGTTNPVTSGGTVVVDEWSVTYALTRDSAFDKVELELPAATVDYFDMATDRTSTSLKAAVFDYDYDGDGTITCITPD